MIMILLRVLILLATFAPQGIRVVGLVKKLQLSVTNINEPTGGLIYEYHVGGSIAWTFECAFRRCGSLKIGRSATLYCTDVHAVRSKHSGKMSGCQAAP